MVNYGDYGDCDNVVDSDLDKFIRRRHFKDSPSNNKVSDNIVITINA